MIPKIIHYCWFGGNPLPKLAQKCIKSWKKYCPDYEIICWDESNYDLSVAPLYVRQAYEAKKWAFVTDYVRLQVVYEHGGIYLDTDVELIKPLDHLLAHEAYFGLQHGFLANTGLGFGAVQYSTVLSAMMDEYADIPFVRQDGTLDLTGCPIYNTRVLQRYGMKKEDCLQTLPGNIIVLPQEYLNPKSFDSGFITVTSNTFSIHHYSASWFPDERQNVKLVRWRKNRWEKIRYFPNRVALRMFGEKRYNSVKDWVRKK